MWKEKASFRVAGSMVMPYCYIDWENTRRTLRSDSPQSRLKIGFLGRRAYHKGWETYKQIVKRFGSDGRYQFFLFSIEEDSSLPLTSIRVSESWEDRQAMLDALKTHHIDVAFLWSVLPETFRFTP
jgi:hypothetical protein